MRRGSDSSLGDQTERLDSGLQAASHVLADASLTGRYFDTFAVAQLRPEVAMMYPRPGAYHLRTEAGRHEVDLLFDMSGGRVVALEFKAGAAPGVGDAKHLIWLRDRLGADFLAGAVIHSGPAVFELAERV